MTSLELTAPPGARDLLLATASGIMREGDIVDVSLSDLSCRSGLNSALVKYYFGNKAGLLKALLDRDWQAIVTSVDALIRKDEWGPEAKLRRHISKVVDTFYQVPYLNRLTMRLVRESDDAEARRIADCYLSPMYRAYEVLIDEGVKAGVFRPVDPQLAALALDRRADQRRAHPDQRDEGVGREALAHLGPVLDRVVRGVLAPDRDPVAGDGIGTVLGLVGELTGERRSQLTSICDDLVETALLDDDARRDAALRGIGGKLLLKRFAPAELFDQGGFP